MTTRIGDIRSAALYINNVLVSKGYIKDDERIDFPSLSNHQKEEEDDDDDDDQDGENASSLLSNDIRTINAIHSLLNTIDSDSSANEQNMRQAEESRRQQDMAHQQTEKLRQQVTSLEKQLQSVQQLNSTLEASFRTIESVANGSKEEAGRLKHVLKQSRQQFATELRKRDVQISKLKDRIQDTRRTKTLSGVSGTLSKWYNSYSTTAIKKSEEAHNDSVTAVSDEIVAMNRALVDENNSLHDLLFQIRDSVQGMTQDHSIDPDGNNGESRLKSYSVRQGSNNSVSAVISNAANAQDLGSEISKTVETITEVLNSPNFVSLTELHAKEQEVESLKEQLRETTDNWQKAVDTMEEWKKYRDKRVISRQPKMLRPQSHKSSAGEAESVVGSDGAGASSKPTRTARKSSVDPIESKQQLGTPRRFSSKSTDSFIEHSGGTPRRSKEPSVSVPRNGTPSSGSKQPVTPGSKSKGQSQASSRREPKAYKAGGRSGTQPSETTSTPSTPPRKNRGETDS